MNWIVPPENGGQVIEVGYRVDDLGLYLRRTVDTSSGITMVEIGTPDWDTFEWEPWNREPQGLDWKISASFTEA